MTMSPRYLVRRLFSAHRCRYQLLISWALISGVLACNGDPAGPGPEPAPQPLAIAHTGHVDPTPGLGGYTDIWGYVDPVTGTEYALLGNHYGDGHMYVVDVSQPATPVVAAAIQVPSFDMKTWGHYAYTVTGGGDYGGMEGRIVDLSDPTAPTVAGAFPSSHNLFIDDQGYMYLEFPGLRIFDLRADPLAPRLVWESTPSGGHDATVVGDRLYDAAGRGATNMYDVSDRANPILLGSIIHPAIGYHHNAWPSHDGNYLFVTNEFATGNAADVTVWDVRQVDDPIEVASITHPASKVHNVAVVGNLAFMSYYAAGFRVFDVSVPEQPSLVYQHDTSPDVGDGYVGAWGVYPFAPSRNVYISDRGTGLHVFSVTGGS
jgi:choice-of-anchor B domain-containing protein